MADVKTLETHPGTGLFSSGNRYGTFEVDGKRFLVAVERGNPTRTLFGRRGFKWVGTVRDAGGATLYRGNVVKSCGLKRLLQFALERRSP